MDSEWSRYLLGQITDWSSGGTPSKKNSDFWDGSIPWISASSMKGRYYRDSENRITEAGLYAGSRLAKPNSILLLVRGSILHQKIPVGIADQAVSFNQDVKAISVKRECIAGDVVDHRYLYYWFKSQEQKLLHMVENTGIGAGKLDTKQLQEMEVRIPPKGVREHISSTLSALDDKIELNQRINSSLEQMAQAIFKCWFVDVEPTRAKMAGESDASICRRLKITPKILAMFPDELEESATGQIPKGWRPGVLSDLAQKRSRSRKPNEIPDNTPYIGLEHMPRGSIALDVWGTSSQVTSNKSGFDKGEFLFGKLRPYFHKVGLAPIEGVCSTDIVVVAPIQSDWASFVLCCISSKPFVEYTNLTSTGTKMPRTSWKLMSQYSLPIPPSELMSQFDKLCQPFFYKIDNNIHENRTLGEMRDALLPKLLKGDLLVKAVEREVA